MGGGPGGDRETKASPGKDRRTPSTRHHYRRRQRSSRAESACTSLRCWRRRRCVRDEVQLDSCPVGWEDAAAAGGDSTDCYVPDRGAPRWESQPLILESQRMIFDHFSPSQYNRQLFSPAKLDMPQHKHGAASSRYR